MLSLRARLAAAALSAGLIVGTPAAAIAGPRTRPAERTALAERSPLDLERLRARCLDAIRQRRSAVDSASARLAAARFVTDGHETALSAILVDTGESLAVLAGQIEADTGVDTMKGHCREIFEGQRVFALIMPRTRLVVGSDVAMAAADALTGVADRIDQAIDDAEAAGADVTGARADLDAMRAAVSDGMASASGIPGLVMDLAPADWNADHEVLTPARDALRSARTDLVEARRLGRQIVAGLRGDRSPDAA